HAPDADDMGAVLLVLDDAAAGQLVALLAMLAAALTIALPGDRGVAAALTTDAAAGQDHVDRTETVLHAMRVMLNAAGVHQETALCRAPPLRRLPDRALGYAGHFGGAPRRPLLDMLGVLFEAGGMLR